MTTQASNGTKEQAAAVERDIRPVKAVYTLIYGEYVDGELVAEYPTKEALLYRRDFGSLADVAERQLPEVQQALSGAA